MPSQQESNKIAPLVGLTGNIGSGKSAAAAIFKQLGAHIIDADDLSRKVVEPGSIGLARIVEHFGKDVLQSDGSLDRKRLGHLVFHNTEDRKALEQIVHPLVRQEFQKQLAQARQTSSAKLIIAMIPLLFETNNRYPELEKIIVVAASPENCRQRIVARDQCAPELADKKLAAQLPIAEKVKRADFVIDNNQGLAELRQQVEQVWQQLLK